MSDDIRPLGEPVDFTGARAPSRDTTLRGRHVTLRPPDLAHDALPLYAVSHPPAGDPAIWTYLFEGPFASLAEMQTYLDGLASSPDRVFFTIVPRDSDSPKGVCSYLNIVPAHGSIELGNIWFSRELQRTTAATEAIFLQMQHAFEELGYRRVEWKCNALNAPSRRAAARFGFRFEGVFEQHLVVKGRNRDTAWFAVTDRRWPAVRAAFESWLDPSNFDPDGFQRVSLAALTAET